jgi:hypothetical protein
MAYILQEPSARRENLKIYCIYFQQGMSLEITPILHEENPLSFVYLVQLVAITLQSSLR